jgi:cysteinyl-tRNA synthetase
VAEDHVLFSPQAMNSASSNILPRYGALSNRSLDEMIAGARVDVAPYKRDMTDFVLWKPAKPGEPSWPSPAGIAVEGRPGWHIECSAMAWKHLGEKFDIHGGGIDLVFPHHENELAQSSCAFNEDRMTNVWMHNGFLQVEGDKMSKSVGNFVTIRELLNDWPGDVLRLSMLKTHYRSPLDWTVRSLKESERTLRDWYAALYIFDDEHVEGEEDEVGLHSSMLDALCDDLNTPKAITELHGLRNAALHSAGRLDLIAFRNSLEMLGLSPAGDTERDKETIVDTDKINQLIEARGAARARKDFKESDRIRDELVAIGVVIKDSKEGTTWEIAR